jgi:arginyl-tRNA synthetase
LQLSHYASLKNEISKKIQTAIAAAAFGTLDLDVIESSVNPSKAFGDISSSVAFRIGKERGIPVDEVAAKLASVISSDGFLEKITHENGFINFYLQREVFAETVIREASELKVQPKGQKLIIEYPSVNPNKPWHVGHLRNALLGDAISNLADYCGYQVERGDYIDDFGLQVVESLWGFMNLEKEPTKKFDHWMGEQYVVVNREMEKAAVKEQITRLMPLMEQDGTYEAGLARQLSEKCIREQYATAFDYGIYHDYMIWESDIVHRKLLDKALEFLREKKIVRKETDGEYAGCTVIDLKSIDNLPKELRGMKESIKVLVRSDGTPTYVAKDIAFHMWKLGLLQCDFKFKQFIVQPNNKPVMTTSQEGGEGRFGMANGAINIIDARQGYPQLLVRLAFELMGRKDLADGIKHLAYGKVEVEGVTLSGRKGTWVGYTADDLLNEAKEKAGTLITKRFKLSEQEREVISKSVALSAIKFEFLKISPEKEIVFSWDNALSFEGNSGPYCQYMHARASRLLEVAAVRSAILIKSKEAAVIADDNAFALLKLISMSEVMTEKACNEMRPNIITDYLRDLALAFSRFYETTPILKSGDDNEKETKLALVYAFKSVFGRMLLLLGVEPLEKM